LIVPQDDGDLAEDGPLLVQAEQDPHHASEPLPGEQAVALRGQRLLQTSSPVGAEAAGVVAHAGDRIDRPEQHRHATGHQAAEKRHALDDGAAPVARGDDDVAAFQDVVDHALELTGQVAVVGVHADDDVVGPRLLCGGDHATHERLGQTPVGAVTEDLDLEVPGVPAGHLRRVVRRAVVDEDNPKVQVVRIWQDAATTVEDRRQVLRLIIGRQDHPGTHGVSSSFRSDAASGPSTASGSGYRLCVWRD